MFERLREALDAALDAASSSRDPRERMREMGAAVSEAHSAVRHLRKEIEATEARLQSEGTALRDAERRGRLAEKINDAETAKIATQFAARHTAWIAVLDRKVEAQRGELTLVESELEEMRDRVREAEGASGISSRRDLERAFQELDRLGDVRASSTLDDELEQSRHARQAREAAAEAQLEELKRQMGK